MNAHFFNRRRFFRRVLQPAWIERAPSNILERCTLVNLSEIGARLTIMDVYDLPEKFALHLTRGSEPGRQCRVIWQRNHEVGIEFLSKAPLERKFRVSAPENQFPSFVDVKDRNLSTAALSAIHGEQRMAAVVGTE
jgi:hypothetical protein